MDNSSSLPDELWLAVLHAGIDNLGWECRDVCSLGLVSRRLHGLTDSNDLWAKLWSKEWPGDVKKEDPGCWKRVFRFRYEREATQRKMAHNRRVLRLQSKAAVLRRDARTDDRTLLDECTRLVTTQEKLKDIERQRQASAAAQVWQPVAVHNRLSDLLEQQAVPVAAQAEALRHELAVCELRIAQLRRSKKRKLAEADEIDSRVAHLQYDPVTALAEERQTRRRDAARKESTRAERAAAEAKREKRDEPVLNEMGADVEQSALDTHRQPKRAREEKDSSLVHRESSTSYCSGGSVDQKVSDGTQLSISEGESREPKKRSLAHIDWSKVGMRPASPQLSTITSKQRI